jgi:hypothetical protein
MKIKNIHIVEGTAKIVDIFNKAKQIVNEFRN